MKTAVTTKPETNQAVGPFFGTRPVTVVSTNYLGQRVIAHSVPGAVRVPPCVPSPFTITGTPGNLSKSDQAAYDARIAAGENPGKIVI